MYDREAITSTMHLTFMHASSKKGATFYLQYVSSYVFVSEKKVGKGRNDYRLWAAEQFYS